MKIIFTNGCFDILHPGHIELFKYARSLGDELIVGIDSDERIKQSKGSTRPIYNSNNRKLILESIKYIDKVVVFDNDDELTKLVKYCSPYVMVIGSDWKDKKVIGSEYAKEVKFFERIQEFSTTKTIENIINR
jgi:D-beta-D-heptose 7-phosphate kinase/D-beta-D-heptose 1-phosphate adenosyltransferase